MISQRPPGAEARAGRFPGPSLIPDLHEIQREHGWLPREELVKLSRERRRPLYEIEGLISFYPHFLTAPPPKTEIACCHDLSCWLQGGDARIAEVRAEHAGDPDVEIREVSCLGRCDRAPFVTEEATELRRSDVQRPNDPYAVDARDYRVLRSALAGDLDTNDLIAWLKEAGLRGMGGAGFPTGTKWELVAKQEAEPKYAICNADESEPGTFKDRQILAEQPHLVLEGLLLGMLATGCLEGWVFIRHEYEPEERVLRKELERVRGLGLLDEAGVTVDIFVSPGGYILGEESALIECMEGHRGEPRNKPPFPGIAGLWGKPTLMNSVETFGHVPVIAERGAEWWKSQGVNGGTGLKFFAVSGHIEKPDVYCVPMGTTTRELVGLAGGVSEGRELLAFQPGGASSNFLGPEQLDVPLDFGPLAEAGSMLGSGAVVVIAEGTDLLAAATNVLRFFRNESCGKCVPCRVGSTKAHTLLSDLIESGGGPDDVSDTILELEKTMRLTSICGLGQVALGPAISVLGLKRGGAAARPQPRPPRAPDQAAGDESPPAS
ncbi:MAG TPA: NADH-ubiquinone oxidoreductase-F iron-sulfur binding region domain-containing protein [Thermoleophilaceae bacterium]|nr:NADH-ubiquinone oxidoreductase-F iron-sulfur binding region domain-containing protein [Thermoleophilaceae bacterium]